MGANTQRGIFRQKIRPEYAVGIPEDILKRVEPTERNNEYLKLVIKAEKIKCSVYSYYGQDYSNFHNKRRFQMHIIPRFVSCYLINKLIPELSYEQIGGLFGFDRATAMNAIREVGIRMSVEKDYEENVFKCELFVIKNS